MTEALGLADLRLEHFAERTGERFELRFDDATLELVLGEAAARGSGPGGMRDPFALLFRGPRDPLLPQANYRLVHPALGEHAVFLVPVGQDDEHSLYEAVFS